VHYGLAARSSLLEIGLLFRSSAFDANGVRPATGTAELIGCRPGGATMRCLAIPRTTKPRCRTMRHEGSAAGARNRHLLVHHRAVAVTPSGLVGLGGSLTLAGRSSNARPCPFDQGSPAVTNRAAKLHVGWAITSPASFIKPRAAKSQKACRLFDCEERRSIFRSQCEK
jgi:hypothetical protein